MRKLFAGPWYGEFGWEIMAWQAYLRSIAGKYDWVVVSGPTGHEGMYEFADRYIPFDVPTIEANMWMNSPHERDAEEHRELFVGPHEFSDNGTLDLITPEKALESLLKYKKSEVAGAINWEFNENDGQKFIKFGKYGHGWKGLTPQEDELLEHGIETPAIKAKRMEKFGYDILYHARHRDDWDSSYRNWFPNHCEKVLKQFDGKTIACIGRKDAAFYMPGTYDLRDMPLSELVNVMASSRVLAGPVSGPIHLATLCGLPQMTWAVKDEHAQRVTKTWNPLGTRVEVIIAKGDVWHNRTKWTPPVKEIVDGIGRILDE